MTNHSFLDKPFPIPPGRRWVMGLGLASVVVLGAGALYFIQSPPTTKTETNPPATPVQLTRIVALGRLEPQEIIHVSAPSSEGTTSRISQLFVEEGDLIQAGQLIAIWDGIDRLQKTVDEAQKDVEVARTRLSQVQAGIAQERRSQQAAVNRLQAQLEGEITTQHATIHRLQAELQHAQSELHRYQNLYQNGAISASDFDSKVLAVTTDEEQLHEATANLNYTIETTQEQIEEAKANLQRLNDVRPIDVAVAEAEVDRAMATVAKHEAFLKLAYIRAPKTGRVLRVFTRAGEKMDNEGILELGLTDKMYAIAEIYESDIAKIRVGQTVTITSNAFPDKLKGTIEHIGWKIDRQEVLSTDPTAATDARVIEVKVQLDPTASQRVAGLTNLQVNVEIVL